MSEKQQTALSPVVSLGDILHAIFRHKWVILGISAAGIVTAALVYTLSPHIYQSEAKLLIKYVLESKSPGQLAANESQIKSLDQQGESIINTELQILSSLDLARQVATAIGPEKILGKASGTTNVEEAAAMIRGNLQADVPKGSTVIRILFQHTDPDLVRPVLNQVIESYLRMHSDIHGGGGGLDDFLTQETDQLHSRLTATEEALRQAKAKAGIISLDDTKKGYADQISRIREAMLQAEAELAERQAAVGEITKQLHTQPVITTNAVETTNALVAASPETVSRYQLVCGLLDDLKKKEQDLLLQFTPQSSKVKGVQTQIAVQQQEKNQLEEENPSLLSVKTSERKSSLADTGSGPREDLITETAKVTALQSKIKVLTQQLDAIRREATNIDTAESSITELQRKLQLEEAHYRHFSESLEQARIDERLGVGRISNISKIQEPSPPFRAASKLLKTVAMILFGTFGLAFGLAFALEFYLDRSLKRAAEVESKVGLPLFMSIPMMSRNGHRALKDKAPKLLTEHGGDAGAKPPSLPLDKDALTLATPSGPEMRLASKLRPFAEALRDRLITFFEVKNLTHKPKLVALTSCGDGAGVSSVAASLSAALSEIGDGNVLLVDMHQQNGSAHQFIKGRLACDLDDALKAETRSGALVQENLYVVQERSEDDDVSRVMPKRFKSLVPRLKASDFDYIIFDMPPVSRISPTPRLARFMDVVLMVVEAEKTDRDVVKMAGALLSETKTNVGIVLNKARTYVPQRLAQEL